MRAAFSRCIRYASIAIEIVVVHAMNLTTPPFFGLIEHR